MARESRRWLIRVDRRRNDVIENPEQIARRAYAAFAEGDVSSVVDLADPGLEWTFLDPSVPDPEPAVCHGRDQLADWMGRDNSWRQSAELEEVVANGDRVLVVTRSPGIDQLRARSTGDLNFHVLTVRAEKIAALRSCRDRNEAIGFVNAA